MLNKLLCLSIAERSGNEKNIIGHGIRIKKNPQIQEKHFLDFHGF